MLSKTQWWIIGGVSALVVGVIAFMLLKKKNNLNITKPKLKNKNPADRRACMGVAHYRMFFNLFFCSR